MSIARHTAYNLVGTVVPIALALVTVPLYLKLIGPERYGILAIAWLILGYFGLFDLGLGRATTQRIAALRDATAQERAVAFGTALATNIGIGVLGALILAPIAWYMFAYGMTMNPALRAETLPSIPLLALSVPIATTMGVLSGALMGRERFLETNRIGIVSTSLFQVIPLLIAWLFSPHLTGLLAASLAARAIGLIMLWRSCTTEFGAGAFRHFDRSQLRVLLAYGGWVTVTSMFGPLLVVVDRFAIGAVLDAIAVTIYTVPMQVTTRLASITATLGNALFPRLAVAEGDEALRLSRTGVAVILACISPAVLAGFVLMHPALVLWVGHDIGDRAAPIGRILLVAAWLNTFAQIPYVRLQASGRPDIVSKVLLAELPFYLPALFWGLSRFGLLGAAVVYIVRVAIDLTVLTWAANRRLQLFGAILAYVVVFALLEAMIRLTLPSLWVSCAIAIPLGAIAILPSWLILPMEARSLILARVCRFVPGGAASTSRV